ncbi:MAG: succinate dehydrogenase assembly factor 2 [Ottowia sp.]|nr:succinate dehydrogenase assembly factor 2 [Ottowia sp.]
MVDTTQLARLRWRARRGLLENDLLITRFLERYESTLTGADIEALDCLFALSDPDLLDILLQRRPLEGQCATPDVVRVLTLLRSI